MKLLIASRKGLFILEKTQNKWQTLNYCFEGVKTSIAEKDPFTGNIWVGLNHGHWGPKLHVSKDGGKRFEEVSVPTFPKDSGRSLLDFWSFGFDSKGRVWLGCEPASLFHSDDLGKSWEFNASLEAMPQRDKWYGGGSDKPCLHSVLVHPQDSNDITVGISCAGVLGSKDRGRSWQYQNKGLQADFLPDKNAEVGQDPHIIVRAKSDTNIIWQQNHCGIYKSIDNGQTWINLSSAQGLKSSFGWGICIDDDDADIAYTLPTKSDEVRVPFNHKLFIQYTSDGGKSWSIADKGLPQENCFDICYRHAYHNEGAMQSFGTTTGNLFCSWDNGRSWKQEMTNLPPIYSLRIV